MKLGDISELTKDDVLAKLGLTTIPPWRERLFGWSSAFGVGLLLGAGASLLLAPKTGHEIRQDLGKRLRHWRDDAAGAVESVACRIAEVHK